MLKAQVECVNVEDKRRESATEILSLCFTQTQACARTHTHTHTHRERYASDQYGNFLSRQKNNLVANSSTRTV